MWWRQSALQDWPQVQLKTSSLHGLVHSTFTTSCRLPPLKQMILFCSCRCNKFTPAARSLGNCNLRWDWSQLQLHAGSICRWCEYHHIANDHSRSGTPPFPVLLQTQKTWASCFPSTMQMVEWGPRTKPLSHPSPLLTSLIHLGLERRGEHLWWSGSNESSKFVICFCIPNHFSWLSTGKVAQIPVQEYQKKEWHLRNWS